MNRILLRLMPALLLGGLCTLPLQATHADEATPAAKYCAQNPQACARKAERLKQRCTADPATCDKTRDRLQELKEKCDADPSACEEKKQQLRERGAELKAKCDADPAACAQKKQEFRERLKERRRNQVSPAGETPPTIPPRPDR